MSISYADVQADLDDLEGKLRVGGRPATIMARRMLELFRLCPDCAGSGVYDPDGSTGPQHPCGYCDGTGLLPAEAPAESGEAWPWWCEARCALSVARFLFKEDG
jgi:hypothetical protein